MPFLAFSNTHNGSVYMDSAFRKLALARFEEHVPPLVHTPGTLCDCSVMSLRSQHLSTDIEEAPLTEIFVELKSGFDDCRFMLHYAGELFLQLPGDPSLITPEATEALYHSFTSDGGKCRHHIELSCGLAIELTFTSFDFESLPPEMPSPQAFTPAAGASKSH